MESRRSFELPTDWSPPDIVAGAFEAMLSEIRAQRPDADLDKVKFAFYIAERAHSHHRRANGEPYIIHPLAVARHIVDLRMDDDSIAAALLHDVVEDCKPTEEAPAPEVFEGKSPEECIALKFGDEVKTLVAGLTKLEATVTEAEPGSGRAAAESRRRAETMRKMLLAMANDFRVMVIKLADRLHNMQTLGNLPEAKQVRIANETLDVYAPLAARLGIWEIKWQLEDLAFKVLHPAEFQQISSMVATKRSQREAEIGLAIAKIQERFYELGLTILDIRGRPKHLFSIYNKMVGQGIPFDQIFDLLALRIIVPTQIDCYRALGGIHELWSPIAGLFSDYIASPKPNGYQSLHTKVMGPSGQPLEVQIRTMQMHQVAEHGVAAHWTYKEGRASLDESRRFEHLRDQLFDWSANQPTSAFLSTVVSELFGEQVFVFTPKRDVIDLPRGSTIIDFAFRVHSDVGMKLVGGKINGTLQPLTTVLENGQVVECLTRSNAQPSLDWIAHVRSSHARSKLKAHFRKLSRDRDAHKGREILDRELRSLGLDPRRYLGEEKLAKVVESVEQCETTFELLAKVGNGLLSAQTVLTKLREGAGVPVAQQLKLTPGRASTGQLHTTDGVMVTRSNCCHPIPGDDVVGYIRRGRGIAIHRTICPNALAFRATESERLVAYDWLPGDELYAVWIRIESQNRSGFVGDLGALMSETKTDIVSISAKVLPSQIAQTDLAIAVRSTEQLATLSARISSLEGVLSLTRMLGNPRQFQGSLPRRGGGTGL